GARYEVIPGVSSFQATAAKLRTELTVPETVQTVVLSRVGGRAPVPESESLENLAEIEGTLCLFLSVKYSRRIQDTLLDHYDPDTPVAIAYRATWPDEEYWLTQLDELHSTLDDLDLQRSTLILVGEAIGARSDTQSGVYDPDHLHIFRPEPKT
ncbi:MAG: SAM-dependent methyltransferase, partial [bacterium]